MDALRRLEALYVKKVADLEEMKSRNDLTRDWGECALCCARVALDDIRYEIEGEQLRIASEAQ